MMHLLEKSESDAAKIMAKLGSATEPARELTYRLYHMCAQKKYSKKARDYNALVQSWPEILRPARNTALQQKPLPEGMKLHDDI